MREFRPLVPVITLLLLSPLLLSSQTGSAGDARPVPSDIARAELLRVGDEVFSVQDVAHAYGRTPGADSLTFYSLDEDSARGFIELYAAFRLRVHEAIDRGMHLRSEFVEEMRRNRDQVALGIGAFGSITGEGYLFQREVVDPGVEEIWRRRDKEHRVAVIFTAMDPANPADTARAYDRSVSMLRAIHAGTAEFARMAADSTDDPSTKARGGDLGWITGGMLPRPMEDAIIETPPGELYPGVIRLAGGYAVLKVLDRDVRKRIRIAHIVFEATATLAGKTDTSTPRQRAEEALARIRSGERFADVAREMSDERTSAEHGGDLLAYYTRSLGFESRPGKLPPAFEDAVYALEEGEISGIVEDPTVGYRIVKRLEDRLPDLEEEQKALRDIYKRYFFEADRNAYIAEVLDRQGYAINRATLEILLRSIDTTRSSADETWDGRIDDDLRKRQLFSLGERTWSVADWIDTVETNPRYRGLPLSRQGVMTSLENIIEYQAFSREADGIETRYPDFGRLLADYGDGALSFELEQMEIYDKVRPDETGAEAYFKANRDRYMSAPELRLTEVFVYTERDANAIYEEATSGRDLAEIAEKRTERMGYRQKRGAWPMSGPKHSELVKTVLKMHPDPKAGTIVEPFNSGGGFSVIRIEEVQDPRQLSWEEARPEVMGDYNDYREAELRSQLLDRLESKFGVEIDEKNLRRALSVM